MIPAYRQVRQNTNITLYIEVYNFDGVLVDADSLPEVSIFDVSHDPTNPDTLDTDAIVIDATSTRISRGIYSYTYSVGANASVGTWFDKWSVVLDGSESHVVMRFQVIANGGTAESTFSPAPVLLENNVVIVTLSPSIEDTDGNPLTGGYQYYFTTVYNPLYSSVKQVRLRAGGYMSNVPDDTINLALFEASLEVDSMIFGFSREPGGCGYKVSYTTNNGLISPTYYINNYITGGPYLDQAKKQYALCKAIIFILSNSLGPAAKKKRLADFQVDYGEGSLKEFMNDLISECKDWEKVLESGGYLTKNVSLPIATAIKGLHHYDYPRIGRLPDEGNTFPGANSKYRPGCSLNERFYFNKYGNRR